MATVNGTADNDVIHVAGDGTLVPVGFTDIALATSNADQILAADGDDLVAGGGGDDTIDGGLGSDALSGGAGNDVLRPGDKDVDEPDTISGGAGVDTVDYSAANRIVLAEIGDSNNQDQIASDVENITGANFNDSLTGSAGINRLVGLAGNDFIHGLGGNDQLISGEGNDSLEGGTGADLLDGGAGIDQAFYSDGIAGVVVNLTTGTGSGGEADGDTLVSIESVIGSDANDTLIGSAEANFLDGRDGNDILNGMAGADVLGGLDGNDVLRGGAGADLLAGGDLQTDTGIDTATYSDSAAAVAVSLAAGAGTGGDAQGDTLSGIENLVGSAFGDHLTGNAADNVLTGGAGGDLLEGGGGIDTISYADSTAGIVVSLATGQGAGGTAQGDRFSLIENIVGGQGTDRLTGVSGANRLQGSGGNDILAGGSGADTLDGGTGIDLASYFGAAAAVTVDLASGIGSGGDAAGDRYLSIENVNGGKAGDRITGTASGNVLNGFEGNDVILGGAGKDALGGGLGADIFAFTAIGDSVVGANADRITDFSRAQADRIDLSAIDASTAAAGNQAFSFIGDGLYTGVAGQLRAAVTSPGVTTIAGDLNGDKVSDFHITLTGGITLTAGDFVL
ncbi:Ca2+-binding RTX toxin-like protein [Inquilinus ginsengisoli]|uniref:calcium-binding protein n=1 Tax=Inquilinus ginsengisoli TaxID=363840 RepID=UPI003D1E9F71